MVANAHESRRFERRTYSKIKMCWKSDVQNVGSRGGILIVSFLWENPQSTYGHLFGRCECVNLPALQNPLNMKISYYAFLLILLTTSISLSAQSWQKIIEGDLEAIPQDFWVMPDGGFVYTLIRIMKEGTASSLSQSVIVRADSEANTIWSKAGESKDREFSGGPLHKKGYLLISKYYEKGTGQHLKVRKLGERGRRRWQRIYEYPSSQSNFKHVATADNGAAVLGKTVASSEFFVLKLDPQGKEEWKADFSDLNPNELITPFGGIVETNGGRLILAWDLHENQKIPRKGFLAALDAEGNRLWSKNWAMT